MYLELAELTKNFIVEKKITDSSTNGRPKREYEISGLLNGTLTKANPKQQDIYRQLQHPITHTIVQKGEQKAKAEDRLINGSRKYYVQGVDDPGKLGLWTIYYVEEREN
jgi:hypothetical protein